MRLVGVTFRVRRSIFSGNTCVKLFHEQLHQICRFSLSAIFFGWGVCAEIIVREKLKSIRNLVNSHRHLSIIFDLGSTV